MRKNSSAANDYFLSQMGHSLKRKEQDTCGRARALCEHSLRGGLRDRRRRSLLWMRILCSTFGSLRSASDVSSLSHEREKSTSPSRRLPLCRARPYR